MKWNKIIKDETEIPLSKYLVFKLEPRKEEDPEIKFGEHIKTSNGKLILVAGNFSFDDQPITHWCDMTPVIDELEKK